jgi:hypothetical protein
MDYGIPLAAGVIHKYYDDIQDTKAEVSPLFMESVKVLMVTTMTISFMRSPSFSAFFLIIICIYWSLDRIDSDFWKACVPIPILTCLVNYDQYSYLGPYDMLQRIIYIFLCGTIMYFEDGMVPEETSVRKTIIRIGIIVLLLIMMFIYKDLSSMSFIFSASLFLIGYLIANIIYHYETMIGTKAPPATPLPKETSYTPNEKTVNQPDDEHIPVSESNTPPLAQAEAQ